MKEGQDKKIKHFLSCKGGEQHFKCRYIPMYNSKEETKSHIRNKLENASQRWINASLYAEISYFNNLIKTNYEFEMLRQENYMSYIRHYG